MKTLIPKRLSSLDPPEEALRKMASSRKGRCVLAVMFMLGWSCISVRNTHSYHHRMLMSFRDGMLNAIKVKEWRQEVSNACSSAVTDEDMKNVLEKSREFTTTLHENESGDNLDLRPEFFIQHCPFVFMDIGTGVGDTIGEFIDSGLEGCRRSDVDVQGFDPMHFDVDTGRFLEVPGNRKGERNQEFTNWVKERIEKFYPGLGPEDYCAYGVEANPLLKADLAKLERHVNRMEPRPLRHLHFLTELAVHSEDDVKKTIFIDSQSNEKYSGSSLFQSHKDVLESIRKFKDTFKYNVDTITLSSLIKQTLSFYREDNSVADINLTELEKSHKNMESLSRQHLILYLDVEGSEFHVLNEAVDSGVLCNFVKDNSNVLDIYIEYHSPEVMNIMSESAKRFIEEVRPFLLSERCGGDNLTLEERMKYFVD